MIIVSIISPFIIILGKDCCALFWIQWIHLLYLFSPLYSVAVLQFRKHCQRIILHC